MAIIDIVDLSEKVNGAAQLTPDGNLILDLRAASSSVAI